MIKKILFISTLSLTCFIVSACTGENEKKSKDHSSQGDIITTIIIGSTKIPDPVLAAVRELEQKGVITGVDVMESFPAQIKITGPSDVINKLKEIPR